MTLPRDALNTDVQEPGDADARGRALRILVLCEDTFPPARVDVAHLFCRELALRGHRIDFILQSRSACDRAFVSRANHGESWVGPTDLGASRMRRLRRHLLDLRNDWRVFRRLRSTHYDLLLVKDKFLSGVVGLVAARIYRVPFVYWLSYPFPEASLASARDGSARYPWLYRIRGGLCRLLLYRAILPASAHVFVQSEQMRRDVAAHGLPRAAMTPIPMGVCAESFDFPASGTRRVLPHGKPCILYLGTLIRVRRLDFLIRVLAQVRREIPDALLYMVGSGDEPEDEQSLLREAERSGVRDALVITGQLPREHALRYALEADVCVSPFYPTPILNSTSPTKLIEYLALARPVVANDHPEQRLVLEQSRAGLCVPYDEQAFADAIVRILRDPQAAALMGERGRAYVRTFRDYRVIADVVETELARIARRSDRTAFQRA